MPWLRQLLEDFRSMHHFHWMKLADLGGPESDPGAWFRIMVDFPGEWHELEASFYEFESPICDARTLKPIAAYTYAGDFHWMGVVELSMWATTQLC